MKSVISSKSLISVIYIFGLIIISACNKDNNDDNNSQLVASAGDDSGVQTGQLVTLDGSGSFDLLGNPFEFDWKFISRPESSNAILGNNASATPAFTPDIQGKYRIELTISNTMEDRDTVTVFAFEVSEIEGTYENPIPGSNVGVRDFAVASNHLFATCEFTEIGGTQANKIAGYNGSVWSALGCGLEDGSIYEMLEYKGELYVTGQFDEIGCISAFNIARWNFENNTWDDVAGGLTGGDNPFGYTLVVYNDELYVGGQFDQAGDVHSVNIAKWNGIEWTAVGNMEGGSVRELTVFNQKLFAGGFFDAVNGINTGHIASFDGTDWTIIGAMNELELKTTGVVNHMAVFNDVLYISGDFSRDDEIISELITWDGNNFSDFGRAFSLYQNRIRELAVINGNLYIGGSFKNVVGSQANNILQWDGESWGIMKQGLTGTVLSIESFENKIYLGGDFYNAGGNNAENITIWTEM